MGWLTVVFLFVHFSSLKNKTIERIWNICKHNIWGFFNNVVHSLSLEAEKKTHFVHNIEVRRSIKEETRKLKREFVVWFLVSYILKIKFKKFRCPQRGREMTFSSVFTWLGTQNPSLAPSPPQLPQHHSWSKRESEGEYSDIHTKIFSTCGPTLDNPGFQYLQRCLCVSAKNAQSEWFGGWEIRRWESSDFLLFW